MNNILQQKPETREGNVVLTLLQLLYTCIEKIAQMIAFDKIALPTKLKPPYRKVILGFYPIANDAFTFTDPLVWCGAALFTFLCRHVLSL